MSDTLAGLTTKVQNILGDPTGALFPTATCTAAIRQALSDWNLRVPQFLVATAAGVADQYEYTAPTSAREIIDILLTGTDVAGDEHTSLDFDQYIVSETLYYRLRKPVTDDDTLTIYYTKSHTIKDLDTAADSTLSARDDQAIVDGASFYAIMIRALSRIETINVSETQSDNYREMAGAFAAAFGQRVAAATRRRKAPVGDPEPRTWDDNYHSWDQ